MTTRDRWSLAALVAGPAAVAFFAPREGILTLAVAGVVVLVGGYLPVGAITGAIVAPLLIAIGRGVSGLPFGISVVIGVAIIASQRGTFPALRAGVAPQIGRFPTRSIPGEKPGVGLFDTPAPHGLLGRSAMTAGAVLIIILSIALAGFVEAALA